MPSMTPLLLGHTVTVTIVLVLLTYEVDLCRPPGLILCYDVKYQHLLKS